MELPPGTEVLLVIVGAGASFDPTQLDLPAGLQIFVDGELRQRNEVWPPLTKDLVEPNLYRNQVNGRYPEVRPLLLRLRKALSQTSGGEPTTTLEAALRRYQERSLDDPTLRPHLTAFRFYLRDLLGTATEAVLSPEATPGTTNYTALVDRCYEWAVDVKGHVCFVNFNYDTLLDHACAERWGLRMDQPSSYVNDQHASLLKPHGSVNWAWRVPPADLALPIAEMTAAVIRLGEPESLSELEIVAAQPRVGAAVTELPALALPVEAKSEFVWPRSHHDHLLGLRGVRRILTVGWRGAEEHVTSLLPPLVMSRARVLVVQGGGRASADVESVRQGLGSIAQRVEFRQNPKGFSQFLASGELDWLVEPVDWPGP